MIKIRLPWPPSLNHMYTPTKRGQILKRAGRDYIELAVRLATLQRSGRYIAGHSCVSITACPPDRRRRDLDNLLKMPIDCCVKAGAIEDDSQIQSLAIQWGPVSKQAYLLVEIDRHLGLVANQE